MIKTIRFQFIWEKPRLGADKKDLRRNSGNSGKVKILILKLGSENGEKN